MIGADAIREIAELATQAETVEVLEIDGRKFTGRAVYEVQQPKLPEPAALVVSTLTGFAEYVRANKDLLTLSDHMIHVVSPTRVDFVSSADGHYHQRFRWVAAQALDRFAATSFKFGAYAGQEAMTIALLALFEDRLDRAAVLRVVGGVVAEQGITQQDDGVTQKVVVRGGVQILDNATVPNPVRLAPFRTFPEVEQPASPFVFRVKDHGGAVHFALFEADGGAWMNEAITNVATWLREQDLGVTIIA